MSMTGEVAEKAGHLCKQLDGFGLDTRPYPTGPVGESLFTAGIEGRQIRLWPGAADVQVSGDARRRQVVLNVTELAREVTQTYHVHGRKLTDNLVMGHFPTRVPGGRLVGFEVVTKGKYGAVVEATVRAEKSRSSLLMGFDEIRQFIAALPERATTVEQAHRALRPSGISGEAIRQGEWFFDPAKPSELAAIEHALSKRSRRMPVVSPLEMNSSHSAVLLTVDGQRYATGLVHDARVKHHRPLHLDGWWRVVRNAELNETPLVGARVRMRTWD